MFNSTPSLLRDKPDSTSANQTNFNRSSAAEELYDDDLDFAVAIINHFDDVLRGRPDLQGKPETAEYVRATAEFSDSKDKFDLARTDFEKLTTIQTKPNYIEGLNRQLRIVLKVARNVERPLQDVKIQNYQVAIDELGESRENLLQVVREFAKLADLNPQWEKYVWNQYVLQKSTDLQDAPEIELEPELEIETETEPEIEKEGIVELGNLAVEEFIELTTIPSLPNAVEASTDQSEPALRRSPKGILGQSKDTFLQVAVKLVSFVKSKAPLDENPLQSSSALSDSEIEQKDQEIVVDEHIEKLDLAGEEFVQRVANTQLDQEVLQQRSPLEDDAPRIEQSDSAIVLSEDNEVKLDEDSESLVLEEEVLLELNAESAPSDATPELILLKKEPVVYKSKGHNIPGHGFLNFSDLMPFNAKDKDGFSLLHLQLTPYGSDESYKTTLYIHNQNISSAHLKKLLQQNGLKTADAESALAIAEAVSELLIDNSPKGRVVFAMGQNRIKAHAARLYGEDLADLYYALKVGMDIADGLPLSVSGLGVTQRKLGENKLDKVKHALVQY